jgi:hypothetical protein
MVRIIASKNPLLYDRASRLYHRVINSQRRYDELERKGLRGYGFENTEFSWKDLLIDPVIAELPNAALFCYAALDMFELENTSRKVIKRKWPFFWKVVSSKIEEDSEIYLSNPRDICEKSGTTNDFFHCRVVLPSTLIYPFYEKDIEEMIKLNELVEEDE